MRLFTWPYNPKTPGHIVWFCANATIPRQNTHMRLFTWPYNPKTPGHIVWFCANATIPRQNTHRVQSSRLNACALNLSPYFYFPNC